MTGHFPPVTRPFYGGFELPRRDVRGRTPPANIWKLAFEHANLGHAPVVRHGLAQ